MRPELSNRRVRRLYLSAIILCAIVGCGSEPTPEYVLADRTSAEIILELRFYAPTMTTSEEIRLHYELRDKIHAAILQGQSYEEDR